MTRARLPNSRLLRADMVGTNLSNSVLRHSHLSKANLSRANLTGADLRNVRLVKADLSAAKLWGADLTRAILTNSRLIGTRLALVKFDRDHPVQYDGTDSVQIALRDRFNWSTLRAIGRLPLFGVSWASLAVALALTSSKPLCSICPFGVAQRLSWILTSTLLLVLGTTLYRLACPSIIQEFSENEWVDQNKNPRLVYMRQAWRRRPLQLITLLLTASGGLLAAWLVGSRVWASIVNLHARPGTLGAVSVLVVVTSAAVIWAFRLLLPWLLRLVRRTHQSARRESDPHATS